MRKTALLLFFCVGQQGSAQAQRCLGQANWTPRPIKLGSELGLGSSLRLLGTAAIGKDRGLFGGVALGIESDADTSNSEHIIQPRVGFELQPGSGELAVCPIALLSYETDSQADFREVRVDLLAGLGLSYPAFQRPQKLSVLLAGALQLGNGHRSVEGCDECADNDFFGLLDLGVGLVVTSRWSVVPTLRLPLGTSRDAQFLFRASLAVGHPQQP